MTAAYTNLLAAAKRVTRAYTAEAEDWNDGEFALWQKDDLVVALVELRKLVSPDRYESDTVIWEFGPERGEAARPASSDDACPLAPSPEPLSSPGHSEPNEGERQ